MTFQFNFDANDPRSYVSPGAIGAAYKLGEGTQKRTRQNQKLQLKKDEFKQREFEAAGKAKRESLAAKARIGLRVKKNQMSAADDFQQNHEHDKSIKQYNKIIEAYKPGASSSSSNPFGSLTLTRNLNSKNNYQLFEIIDNYYLPKTFSEKPINNYFDLVFSTVFLASFVSCFIAKKLSNI